VPHALILDEEMLMTMLETLLNFFDRSPLHALLARRNELRCEEIMKRDVECVRPDDSLQQAARKMRDLNVGFLPVCAEEKKVIGTVTDRDIAVRAVADDRSPAYTRVGDVMTREVVAVSPRDPLTRAEELMSQHHKSRLVVLDINDQLVGVISLSDIAQRRGFAAARTLRGVTMREARA
jgi:CBS domain-containing protein